VKDKFDIPTDLLCRRLLGPASIIQRTWK